MACEIPRTSRFGIRLVKSDPGPMVITSAFAIASSVCGIGPTSGGTRNSSRMRSLLAVILVSPRTRRSIFHKRFEFNVRGRRGIDVSARQQNFRRQANGFGKIRGKRSECGQKQIAEAVAFKSRAFVESVTKELRQQRLVFAQSDNAVADVAGRKHVQLFAQASAGAAVVADGDDRAKDRE